MYSKYISFDSAILYPSVYTEEMISKTREWSMYKYVHCGGVYSGKSERTQNVWHQETAYDKYGMAT